jgi:hypothetical protein
LRKLFQFRESLKRLLGIVREAHFGSIFTSIV